MIQKCIASVILLSGLITVVHASTFDNFTDFSNATSELVDFSFATTGRVGVGGATFTNVQNGNFVPSSQTSTHEAFAAKGAVFGADASDLGFAPPQVPSRDNGTALEPFSGTDGVFVSDFGPVSDTLTAFLVDPSTSDGAVTAATSIAVGGRVVTPGNATLSVFDSNGNLIETASRSGNGFLGVTSSTPIAGAVFFFDNMNGSALDSFTFSQADAVPEPNACLLLGMSVLFLFVSSRNN